MAYTIKPAHVVTSIKQSPDSRYYSDSYFPIDEAGFGAEGQTDCMGTLHNFA
jgi:hypothetical protein